MRRKPSLDQSDCELPHVVDAEVLSQFVPSEPRLEAQAIREYVEWQASESVVHLEKLKTEYVFENRYDAWDVTTTADRYWVITTPNNLYSQKFFPSLDYTITFHVGLAARIFARQREAKSEERDRLLPAHRKWLQAADALDRADEAEEFQAIGMRCREALLEVIQAARQNPVFAAAPSAVELKAADFLGWSAVIADQAASGPSASESRGYLKSLARATWQLVAWLTHAKNAFRRDVQMALGATEATLSAYGAALVRFEEAPPERCPNCSSYRTAREFFPGRSRAGRYITVCQICGWSDQERLATRRVPKRKASRRKTTRKRGV
jgi:hypothetical protein